jgi:polynucleotide 5'-hydroxyl-kinase GRC3/NOL9
VLTFQVIGSFPIPVYPHITPDSWSAALASFNPPRRTLEEDSEIFDPRDETAPIVALVKGPKRSGKSTFARAALNRLLGTYEKVAWLECDLGQGEFGCGGVVGMWIIDQPVFGPPFTHPAIPERGHYLGTYTPLTCPDEYIAAIDHLVNYYRYELQYPLRPNGTVGEGREADSMPLVINTQGWVKGLGEELLRSIEAMAEPTHVFAFESEPVNEGFDAPGWTRSPTYQTSALPEYPLRHGKAVFCHTLVPAPASPLQARYTPADLRLLSTLSYFYSHIGPTSLNWNLTTPLVAQPPWEVTLGEAIKEVYLIGEGAEGVLPSDLSLALNGCIVALLEQLSPPEQHDGPQGVYIQARPPPSLEETTFLGLAIVRATSSGTPTRLQILTPLAPELLSRASVLVKNGAIELPTAGMLDWREREKGFPPGLGAAAGNGNGWEEVPFFDTGNVGIGGERRRFRRNLMRKGM